MTYNLRVILACDLVRALISHYCNGYLKVSSCEIIACYRQCQYYAQLGSHGSMTLCRTLKIASGNQVGAFEFVDFFGLSRLA